MKTKFAALLILTLSAILFVAPAKAADIHFEDGSSPYIYPHRLAFAATMTLTAIQQEQGDPTYILVFEDENGPLYLPYAGQALVNTIRPRIGQQFKVTGNLISDYDLDTDWTIRTTQ